MNFAKLGVFALYGIAGRSENRYCKGNLQRRNIEDQFEAQPLSKQIVRRACDKGVNGPSLEGRDSHADIAELNVLKILQGIDPKAGEGGLSKHVRIRTDPVDAQPFSLQFLDASDLPLANNVPRHAGLALSDDHQIFCPSHNCPRRGKSADDPDIRFPREQGSSPGGTGSDKDELNVKSLLLEKTGFFGDPHG